MQFTRYELGHLNRGDAVEITLDGDAPNVRLMNSSNFSNYKSNRRYDYVGGIPERSTLVLIVPSSGYWYIIIDFEGLRGSVNTSVRIIKDY